MDVFVGQEVVISLKAFHDIMPSINQIRGRQGVVDEIWPDGTILVGLYDGTTAYLTVDDIEPLERE